MKAITSVAVATLFMLFSGVANAQQGFSNQNKQTPQVEDNNARGQRGQGRRGNRRGGMQGQQGQGGTRQGQGQRRRGGQQGQQGQQGRRGGAQMMDFIFQRFDKDKNGSLSQNEAPDRMKQRFNMLDTNGDKSVSKEELQAAFDKMEGKGDKGQAGGKGQRGKGKGKGGKEGASGRRGQMDPAAIMKKMDANKDGVLTKEEAPERMKKNFDRIDADGNGKVTADEFKTSMEKMKKGGQNGAQKGQDRRGKSNPEDKKPVKPKRPPMAKDGA